MPTALGLGLALSFSRGAVGGGEAPAYLGNVATRMFQPKQALGAATATWCMGRNLHVARDDMDGITIVYPMFSTSTANVTTIKTGGTVKASIEYPAGTFTQNDEGAVAFADGYATVTFPGLVIPKDALFWDRPLVADAADGIVFCGFGTNCLAVSEGWVFGTGTPTDLTGGGTVAGSFNRSQAYFPVVIASMTKQPTGLFIGDSRLAATNGDTVSDANADVGEIARGWGPTYGYSNFGIGSSRLSQFLSNSLDYLDPILPYFSHIVNQHAVNDLQNGFTAAQEVTQRELFAANAKFAGKTIIGCTSAPVTSSTDSWATIANQTVSATGLKLVDFNAAVRSGIAGEAAYFDISDGLDPTRINKWPVDGSAFYSTPDGLHESQAGAILLQSSGVIDMAKITR